MGLGKLKVSKLPIVVAEASDLPLGSMGEFITADTLKPYLDAISSKATPSDIATAITALETKLVGTAGISVDTFGEMKAFVDSIQAIQSADKDGILATLALCVKTADIMPIVNAKAEEISVANRLASKVETADIMPIVNAKATKIELQAEVDARLAEITRVQTIANSKTTASYVDTQIADLTNGVIATKITTAQATTIAQNIADILEQKIYGGVGTEADTMAELKAMVETLQDLSEADVNGVITTLATKLDKSVYDAFIQTLYTATQVDTELAKKIDKSIFSSIFVPNESLSVANLSEDLPEANGSGSLELMIVNTLTGAVKKVKMDSFLTFISTCVDSPVFGRFEDLSDLISSQASVISSQASDLELIKTSIAELQAQFEPA